ncbi:Crp/Fnr family transcriptional regulator [Roseospira goensis]|uniref:CRP-like cAMP-binding protein n=1 Tax=Roseospira goensis TaxID=391922 RepID=A0A7W6RWR4_9PROT|nr:cyclic nucleotide-binding domain-containing protein [Roseospira goensis]MBB4284587.1 CRP-like cAMP-binding protein [Roseospira goensis]
MVSIKPIRTLLAENPFFAGLSDDQFETMSGCGTIVHFKAGAFLLREGGAADTFYLIRNGVVAIESSSPAGGPLSVARVGAGGIAGYSWLFPPYRNAFDALAISHVSAVALDGACLRGKAEADHELGYQLMKRFAQVMLDRLQATRRQMLDVYGNVRTTDDTG